MKLEMPLAIIETVFFFTDKGRAHKGLIKKLMEW